MRRVAPFGLVVRLLSAFLVLLGTSGSGFAAILCGTMRCEMPAAVPVAKSKPAASACCLKKEKAEPVKKQERKCCCEFKPDAQAAKLTAPLHVPSATTIELPPSDPLPIAVASPLCGSSERILSYTDASPPDPERRGDRGRAPPTA